MFNKLVVPLLAVASLIYLTTPLFAYAGEVLPPKPAITSIADATASTGNFHPVIHARNSGLPGNSARSHPHFPAAAQTPETESSLPSDSIAPSFQEAKALLTGVCDAGMISDSKGQDGQKAPVCLRITNYPGKACVARSTQDAMNALRISRATYGSFSAAGVTEAIIDYEGCEPHVTYFGGSALLREQNGQWHLVSFAPGKRSSTCLKYLKKDGTAVLACQGDEGGILTTYHVTGDKIRDDVLLDFDSPGLDLCWDMPRYTMVSLKGWSKANASATSGQELTLNVKYADAPMTKLCTAPDMSADTTDAAAMPDMDKVEAWGRKQVKAATLTFRFDDGKFTPEPASRGLWQKLRKLVNFNR